MSYTFAWEITPEDVQQVADQHGVKLNDDRAAELCDQLDHDTIVKNVLWYDDFDNQAESMCDDIEDALLQWGVVSGDKVYCTP